MTIRPFRQQKNLLGV